MRPRGHWRRLWRKTDCRLDSDYQSVLCSVTLYYGSSFASWPLLILETIDGETKINQAGFLILLDLQLDSRQSFALRSTSHGLTLV